MYRRRCCHVIVLIAALCMNLLRTAQSGSVETPIDRYDLVSRHNVHLTAVNIWSPLSVGNGRFCFTADVTGLQTFEADYAGGIPLSTMADWSWHSFPNTGSPKLEDTFVEVDTYGRQVPYPIDMHSPSTAWLRGNPHRFNLARIGLVIRKQDGTRVGIGDLDNIEQTLDLWRGVLKSRFEIEDQPVVVETCCHPEMDAIAAKISSPLLATGQVRLSIAFAYPTGDWGKLADDWHKSNAHSTRIVTRTSTRVDLERALDQTRYGCTVSLTEGASLVASGDHHYLLSPEPGAQDLAFAVTFSEKLPIGPVANDFAKTKAAAEAHWKRIWSTGGAVDLSLSRDPRWKELERRIILSRYLTAIQSAGRYPSAETGLTCNSWHGKFHMEMHWWHSVHFALWDRLDILERQLNWYLEKLPVMRATARRQGYDGVRWGKMLGPAGRESPSSIGPLIIWQQPHPIYYAELCYRRHRDKSTLQRYATLVFETASFMASFLHWDEDQQLYRLGPPLISAQESYDFKTAYNPIFELCYWYWGLTTAQRWRERLGMKHDPQWDHILAHLPPLPTHDGAYAAIEPEPYTERWDHPLMLMAVAVSPRTPLVDMDLMRQTLRGVCDAWNWSRTWGWDYPMVAMAAARVGEPELAVDALFNQSVKNRYLPNGHNYQADHLPVYLPGNGGLLSAVAMMAAGWDGCPDRPAPGFPDDGQWQVRWENLHRMP